MTGARETQHGAVTVYVAADRTGEQHHCCFGCTQSKRNVPFNYISKGTEAGRVATKPKERCEVTRHSAHAYPSVTLCQCIPTDTVTFCHATMSVDADIWLAAANCIGSLVYVATHTVAVHLSAPHRVCLQLWHPLQPIYSPHRNSLR